jgi:eukaryotic-like serine/threonine-protein kinase
LKRIDDKYEVTRELGHGGMGSVFEGRHERTGRRVAIKVIKDERRLEPDVVERFQREARAAGSIESDHITEVLDCGVDRESGVPYLVMELLAGEDLDSALKRLGPLKPDLAARVVAQMLMGLEKAHDAGVVHRDIKPANVFLAKKESGAIVAKVGDFGVAKVKADPLASAEHQLTQTSALLGSPAYMSPEQVKGAKDIDARADLWSTGVVLYQCLAGATPHAHADTLGLLLLAICSEDAPPVQSKAPWVSAGLAAVVTRALDLDIDKRFQSAGEMLRAVLATLPNGRSLDASMFVPLTNEERAFVAEALPGTAVGVSSTATGVSSTETGVTKASEPPLPDRPSARRRTGVAAVTTAVSLGIGALVFWVVAP